MKKLLALMMVISVLFTVMPAGLSASAADPEGTITVYNDTATFDDNRFYAYTNPSGDVNPAAIGGDTSSSYGYVPSKYTDDNGYTAIRSKTVNYSAWYRLLPDGQSDASKAGVYDIYFYNIADTAKDEQLWNGSKLDDTHPDYHAQYTVHAAGVQTTYYIDQLNVLNGQDGWVKLGTHYFDGVSGEKVVVTKNYVNGSSTYLSTVKFVPVDKPSSAKLIHMHMRSYDNSTGKYTHIETEDTPVTSNTIIRQLPNTYNDAGARAKKISLTFQAEDPDATVQIVSGDTGVGRATTEYYANADEVFYRDVVVTSEDEKNIETYRVAVGVDGASVIDYKAENAVITNRGALNTASTNPCNYNDLADAKSTEAYPDGYTKRLRLYGLGDTATWTVQNTEVTAPGYYSAYVWSTSTNGFQDEKTEIIVNHAGVRNTCRVDVGNYHLNNPKWVYAGSYYFEGSGDESVAAMKTSATHDSAALILSGIRLVPCKPSKLAEDFDGISITAAGETVSMTKKMIEDGKYVQPLQPDDYTTVEFKVIGSNENYEYIKINDAEVNVNTAMNLAVNNGAETNVNLEIKLVGEKEKNYKLTLYKETTNVTVGAGGNLQNVEIPVSTDFSTKVTTVKNSSADAGFRLENLNITEDAYYKILVWKPGFNYHVKSNNTKAATGTEPKAMASSEQTVKINTGAKVIKKTIDWTGTESEWVDLGTYQMKPSGFTNTATEFCVTFDYLDDAYTLINKAKYLKLSKGFLIDGDFYTDKGINDSVLYTSADTINVTPLFGESIVTINGNVVPDGEAYACDIEAGINRIKITVGDSEINFAVVKSGSLIAHNDDKVSYAESSSNNGTSGYNNLGTRVLYQDTATASMPAGEGKLSVWFDALTSDMSGMTSEVTVSAGSDTKTISVTESGWYEIGSYTFAANDKVTISTEGTNVALFSAVKLDSVSNEFFALKPVVEMSDKEINLSAKGNASAWVYAYNGTQTPKNVSLYVAVYEKTADDNMTLVDVDVKKATVENGFAVITTDDVVVSNPENAIIKAFIWNTSDLSPVTAAIDIPSAVAAE